MEMLRLMEQADDLVADVFAAEEDLGFDPVAGDPFGIGGEERGFADVFEFEERHGEPLEAHAEAAMRGHPIFEDAQIVGEIGRVHPFHSDPFEHRVIGVAPLAARGDFCAGAKEIEGIGELGIARLSDRRRRDA